MLQALNLLPKLPVLSQANQLLTTAQQARVVDLKLSLSLAPSLTL